MKVYLSGGLDGDWQDKVKNGLSNATCFDPREIESNDPEIYTFEELDEIYECDIVFAYLESDNPSGIGLALEIGYAKGYNKYVVLVNEKNSKKFDIVEACADKVFDDLSDAIQYTYKFIEIENQ